MLWNVQHVILEPMISKLIGEYVQYWAEQIEHFWSWIILGEVP